RQTQTGHDHAHFGRPGPVPEARPNASRVLQSPRTAATGRIARRVSATRDPAASARHGIAPGQRDTGSRRVSATRDRAASFLASSIGRLYGPAAQTTNFGPCWTRFSHEDTCFGRELIVVAVNRRS